MSRGSPPEVRAPRQSGFTIIEALVALMILATTVMMFQFALVAGWRGLNRVGAEGSAVAVALARLEAAGVEAPLREGVTTGQEAELDWKIEVTRYERHGRRSERVPAWWVSADVSWRDPYGVLRSIRLATVKLDRSAP